MTPIRPPLTLFLGLGLVLSGRPATAIHVTTRLLRTETAYTDDFAQIAILGQSGVGGILNRAQITTNLPLDLLAALNLDAKVGVLRETEGYPLSVAIGAGWLHHFRAEVVTREVEKSIDQSSVSADATIYKLFLVASKELDPALRIHGGMQMLRGGLDTRIEGEQGSEDFPDGTMTATLLTDNTSLMAGLDLRISDALIVVAEGGRDLSNGATRAGLGMETGLGPLRLGLGATWPGIDLSSDELLFLDEEQESPPSLPFFPHLTLYFRF